jgi:hypothetical protein
MCLRAGRAGKEKRSVSENGRILSIYRSFTTIGDVRLRLCRKDRIWHLLYKSDALIWWNEFENLTFYNLSYLCAGACQIFCVGGIHHDQQP